MAASSWYYGLGDSYTAEILAVRDGIRLAADMGIHLSNLEVEMDAKEVVMDILNEKENTWKHRNNWKEILSMAKKVHSVKFICREGNKAADYLARRGRELRRNILEFAEEDISNKLRGILFWEKKDLPYVRRCKVAR